MSDTDLWVGSWRPHKPRGPIAALYSSPGPKYALPGNTGRESHDPRKAKAPAFSFGIRRTQSLSDASPGPSYLVPSSVTRKGPTDSRPTHFTVAPRILYGSRLLGQASTHQKNLESQRISVTRHTRCPQGPKVSQMPCLQDLLLTLCLPSLGQRMLANPLPQTSPSLGGARLAASMRTFKRHQGQELIK
ncbi:hypothetical protein AGOR_G00180540 [Albula goreensis]|uniref:Uncharacterized protein n=1 Tax=Albula goreensis TaxID=1534307 RepID=A0A8T3CW67_9TELE|nr:hypothetical protein AGOR_G00180540 [Albula goreensis]